LQTEYIMKMYVPLEAHVVGDSLRLVNHPGGWIEGPRIKGKIVPPSGDWLRTTANGLNENLPGEIVMPATARGRCSPGGPRPRRVRHRAFAAEPG
jgi:Protein of unknown function (DUF3237)